ncbi:MAG: aminotransferase class IV [Deltaproteobacteria bacterium]|nr:aminotransferase class IV [Deltaproteobacteria bacterium]
MNGNYYQADEASLKVSDRGFLFGDGIFTTIKVESSVPLFLDKHINRLRSSCRFFGIEFYDPGFSDIIDRLLKKNQLKDARVKIIISRGIDFKNQIFNYGGGTPTIAVLISPLDQRPPQPVKLCISNELRGNESIYHYKTTSYLQNLYHKTIAREKGFDDNIILNWKEQVLETSTANLFFIIGNKIITPPRELPLLNGIMRQNLLSQGSIGNYILIEDHLTKKDLKKIGAAFITSAIVGICPVNKIEDQVFSVEKPEAVRQEWLQIRGSILKKW